MRVKILLILLTLIIPFSSFGKEKMEPLFDLNEETTKKLEPEIYSTKKKEISGIFDIPIDNAIASNSVPGTNAITLITFKNGKVKYKTIIKNFKSYVSGGVTTYLPIFSEEWIGYSQNRGFNLININTKKVKYYSIAGSFDHVIGTLLVLDDKEKIFLFDCASFNKKESPGFMRIIDLKSDEQKLLSEKELKNGFVTSSNKSIFTYNDDVLKAYDFNFNEIDHPLVNIFNKEKKDFKSITELFVHPKYPVAVFCEYDFKKHTGNTWMISWRAKDIKSKKPLMKKLFESICFGLKFSYDGKWFIFESLKSHPSKYMIMPCSEEYPNFFGKPILLGEVPEFPSGGGVTAVTRNPAGFVIPGTDDYGDSYWLKKWDFTKAEELIEKE